MTDAEIGRKAMLIFHQYWRAYPAASKYSFDQMMALLKKRPLGGEALLDGLGFGIRETGMSDSKVTWAMRNLASASQGRLPARNQDFFTYLSNEAVKVSFVDAAIYTAVESAKDIGSGVEEIGNSVLTAGKILNFLLPVIILGAIYFYLDDKSGGRISSGLKAFK